MSDSTINCPKCGTAIPLTETLAAPMVAAAKKRLEADAAAREQAVAKREAECRASLARLEQEKAAVEEQIAAKLKAERALLEDAAKRKARAEFADELTRRDGEAAELRETLRARDAKLAEAQKAEAELRRKQRELDDKLREADLAVEKRVSESLAAEREKARREADDAQRLRIAEKEKTIADLQGQLQEALRKAEQGSQQQQGEVLELELETTLRLNFPRDRIEPVPKGEFGGDTVHKVVGPGGQCCGTILWESKRTKNWSPSWLPKLREDQRCCKAEVAVIVSAALPDGIDSFGNVDGVWVTSTRAVLPVACVLRQLLLEVATTRSAGEGKDTKIALVYEYMTGPRFRQRVEAIVEAFTTMREDLDKERRAIEKQWAKRDAQIERVMRATVGMYGDLQGIAGRALGELEGLDVKLLENGD